MIRALIVDDEPLARRGIRARLQRESDVMITAEVEDGPQAVAAIRQDAPDLVFLDVQMPGLDGFQVLEALDGDQLPVIVFVTAHDAYAVRAFEIHALDYLLKPFSAERFVECLRRARQALARGAHPEGQRVRAMLAEVEAKRSAATRGFPQRFAVRDRDRILFVKAADLHAIEAAGNYVTLVEDSRRLLMRLTLAEMERSLDPARFARIHRSTIVNLDRVRAVRRDAHGDCEVELEGGPVYRMSRTFRERVLPGTRGDD